MDAQRLKENRRAFKAALTRKKNVIRSILASESTSEETVNEVMKRQEDLEEAMAKFREAHNAYQSQLTNMKESEESVSYFDREYRDFLDLKEEIAQWLALQVRSSDSVSNTSRNGRKSVTGSAAGSTASEARLRASARRAALLVEAATLSKRQALAEEKLQLRLREDRLRLETEIEKVKAQERIYADFETIQGSVVEKNINFGASTKFASTTASNPVLHSQVTPKESLFPVYDKPFRSTLPKRLFVDESIPLGLVPKPYGRPIGIQCNVSLDDDDSEDEHTMKSKVRNPEQNRVLESIQVVQQQVERQLKIQRLPKTDLMPFDGNPLNYFLFIKSFENNVEKCTEDDSERLQLLIQYCTGRAKDIVKGCGMMDASKGYQIARRLLEKRFGDKYLVTDAWIKKVADGPAIKANDYKALQDLADDLENCEIVLNVAGRLNQINNDDKMIKILRRVPNYVRSRWQRIVQDIREEGNVPNIADLKDLIAKAAREKNDPVFGSVLDRSSKEDSKQNERITKGLYSFSLQAPTVEYSQHQAHVQSTPYSLSRWKCFCCHGNHRLGDCKEFEKKSSQEKLKFIREKKLCENCLSSTHFAGGCKIPNACKVQDCTFNRKHLGALHTALLALRQEKQEKGKDNGASFQPNRDGCVTDAGFHGSINSGTDRQEVRALPIVPVRVKAKGQDKIIEVYALLDSGSTSTWCSSELLRSLNAKGTNTQVSLTTIERDNIPILVNRVKLEVMDLHENVMIELPEVFSKDKLNISASSIARQEDIDKWSHLKGISLPSIEGRIELLIGQDVPEALEPIEIRRSEGKGPYATRSSLGWTINGPLGRRGLAKSSQVNFLRSDDLLNRQFNQFMNLEFVDSIASGELSMSRNDKRVMSCYDDFARLVDGHYEIAIPWISASPDLPNNRPLAEHRLRLLKKRLLKDRELYMKYSMFMDDLMKKNYAREVPKHLLNRDDGKVWYLPHHSVTHPQKPDKVRIVFDCAAKYRDVSLNSKVMQGPDLTSKLVGVLIRFRQEHCCLMSDIESMYHQVKVNPDDVDALRFLWYPDNDLNKEPKEYQMLVHLFGGIWSSSCANYALHRTADDNAHKFAKRVTETVKKNFYVDDCLKSVSTEDDAIQLAKDLSDLLSQGGFHLTKWNSNSRNVINSIPIQERAKEVKELNLDSDALPIERALGIRWNVEADKFIFLIKLKNKPLTRRGLLSTLSSIFDPLGFVCPFVLSAKLILRELCHLGWDDTIPDSHALRWKEWLGGLTKLQELSVDRCFKPKDFGDVLGIQLHHFADASENGYGAVSFLRLVDNRGNVNLAFVLGKSRVTPLKRMTIPRLELSAATVAVRLDQLIKKDLELTVDQTVFWTDSTSVLGYIQNQNKRYHTFVANRLSIIHDGSSPDQWMYVDSKSNPADIGSRGVTADQLLSNSSWIHGPEFLMKPEQSWPVQVYVRLIPKDDPEVKTQVCHCATDVSDPTATMDRVLQRFSLWFVLKKTIAWILRYKEWLLSRVRRQNPEIKSRIETGKINAEEMQTSEQEILKYIQRQCFSEELNNVPDGITTCSKSSIKRSSPLYKLDPVKVDGLLRVGGRLKNADLAFAAKHPIILPKKHPVIDLLIRYYHFDSGHSGQEYVLSLLREHYWIIKGRVAVRKILRSCFVCKRRRQPTAQQMMANLPFDRVTPDKPPFAHTGVDCFGPFSVKRGRTTVKRYGVIFTCLTVRAIHLEVAFSLDTSSFINAMRRFISRRGNPEIMRSDNGSNFKGGEKEIRQAVEQWNQRQIHEFLLQKNIRWIYNPPFASHMGGVWERNIRTVRKVMSALVKEQVLDDEGLYTLMCEIESIVNGRPLTKVSDDPKDLQALTPNHLLLLRSGPELPPGLFRKEDAYSVRRWRQVQYMADVFWRRWTREYLPSLQTRNKWQKLQRNLQVGDLVLLVDDSTPRCAWPLARITEVYKNKDGCVRQVRIKTKSTVLTRPINKLCLLENNWD